MKGFSVYGRLFLWRSLLVIATSLLTLYFFYRVTFINFSPLVFIFSLILFIAELHTIFHLYGMFYALWPRKYQKFNRKYQNKALQLNIFICVCGEPIDVVRQTIQSAKVAVTLYNKEINPVHKARVIVLNDGKVAKKDNWRDLASACKELSVLHFARNIAGGFKAGNINNGLLKTPTKDPHQTLDIVLDADFSVKERFLFEIIKPFRNKSIDFAQSPQRYKNEDSWVAKASAAHQIFFFEHICHAKAHDNALFLCGTNFAIRRSALDSIGGMDTRFITEDFATSLELHLTGKKGVFIPDVLAEGIAPATLKQYFSQQQRWSKGSFDVAFSYLKQILFGKLTLRQKFHYMLSATYYLIGVRDLILMLAPLPFLLFGVSLINANTWQFLLFVYAPLFISNFIMYLMLFKHPFKSLVLDIASFPVFVSSFLSSALKKDLSFIVTIKKYERENPFAVYKLQLMVCLLLTFGLIIGVRHLSGYGGALLNYFWAAFDLTFLLLGFYLIARENYDTNFIEAKLLSFQSTFISVIKSPYFLISRTFFSFLAVGLVGYIALPSPVVKALSSFNIVEQSSAEQTQQLLIPTTGVYYGYYSASLNSRPRFPVTSLVSGEKTSLVMYYQDWSKTNTFDPIFLTALSEDHRIPIITWEPWDTTKSISIKPEDIISGKYDKFIKRWAKDATRYNKPFFLRFAHEMNGDWYPWGAQRPEIYKQMWIHVHDIFVKEGASNVIWVWSPNNTDEKGSTKDLLSYYPGDAYVDWVGFSGFNWGTTNKNTRWMSFTQVATDVYNLLTKLNKPIIVAETSSVSIGGDKQDWFQDTLKDIEKFPKIKAVVFFNEKIKKADFSLESGEDFQKVAKENIVSNPYFLKNPIVK